MCSGGRRSKGKRWSCGCSRNDRNIALASFESIFKHHLLLWLEALTAYCEALADIHTYNNESVHEKLHALAGRTGLRKFPPTP